MPKGSVIEDLSASELKKKKKILQIYIFWEKIVHSFYQTHNHQNHKEVYNFLKVRNTCFTWDL